MYMTTSSLPLLMNIVPTNEHLFLVFTINRGLYSELYLNSKTKCKCGYPDGEFFYTNKVLLADLYQITLLRKSLYFYVNQFILA